MCVCRVLCVCGVWCPLDQCDALIGRRDNCTVMVRCTHHCGHNIVMNRAGILSVDVAWFPDYGRLMAGIFWQYFRNWSSYQYFVGQSNVLENLENFFPEFRMTITQFLRYSGLFLMTRLIGNRPGKSCKSSSSGKFRALQCPQNSLIRDMDEPKYICIKFWCGMMKS